jgi:hypothetical protein
MDFAAYHRGIRGGAEPNRREPDLPLAPAGQPAPATPPALDPAVIQMIVQEAAKGLPTNASLRAYEAGRQAARRNLGGG